MTSEQPTPPQEPAEQRQIQVRRAPRFVPFLVLGGVLGLIAAGIAAFAGPANPDYDRGTVLGFFSVLFAIFGVLLGALVALVLDRISVRRSRQATVQALGPEEQDVPEDQG